MPRNYDGREFRLDGCIDMDITFEGKTLTTTVYIKMNANDSEGVCRQIGIVTYHPSLTSRRTPTQKGHTVVHCIKVSLVQTLELPPSQSALVPVRFDPCGVEGQTLHIEGQRLLEDTGLVVEDAVVTTPSDGAALVVISNMTGLTLRTPQGTVVREAHAAEIVTMDANTQPVDVRRLSSSQDDERSEKLLELLPLQDVPPSDAAQLRTFLVNNHTVFSLDEGERGETSLVTVDIDTGDASPRKQPPRRMPFMAREEVARQLKCMQRDVVIQPSNPPWSSPVVMVRNKDGSHRFCIDYRALNSITKADTFPLVVLCHG